MTKLSVRTTVLRFPAGSFETFRPLKNMSQRDYIKARTLWGP